MGATIWTFEGTGAGWRRLSSKWADRFWRGEERVEGGADALLAATVIVQLEDREPMELAPPRFDRWSLLADGTLDRDQVMEAASAPPGVVPLGADRGAAGLAGRRPGEGPRPAPTGAEHLETQVGGCRSPNFTAWTRRRHLQRPLRGEESNPNLHLRDRRSSRRRITATGELRWSGGERTR